MRYIYGIVTGTERSSLGNVGLHGEAVVRVSYKGISALISNLPEDRQITLEDTRVHESVLRRAMENSAVVPVGFGFTAKDDSDVEKLLRRGYFVFRDALEHLRGKIQVEVKVSWNDRVLLEVLRDVEGVRAIKERMQRNPDDPMIKTELGRRVDVALRDKKKDLLPEVLARLNDVAIGFKENRIRNDETLLNASFLLDGEKIHDFFTAIDELEKRYEGRLAFKTVSPLPPYNFVDIRVEKPDYERLKKAKKSLGLGDDVSISEVKTVFKRMARTANTGGHSEPDTESRLSTLKAARDALIEYCENFTCPVTPVDVQKMLIVRESASTKAA